jgi:protein-S-isoprenylcysteine O-methyltransferase Ste14
MEYAYLRQAACVVFFLLMGAARYYFSTAAGRQPTDRSGPSGEWARHIPAYLTSTAWTVFVAWRVFAPPQFEEWDKWYLASAVSDALGWIAMVVLAAGFALFWYSHHTIGRYWSIRIHMKQAHRLITNGPYAYIRHPLYTALFLGYLGTLLALQSWMLAVCFPVFVASYLVFAREEEGVMERGFGAAYETYRNETGMFLPRWSRLRGDLQRLLAPRRARRRPRTR